MRKALVPLCYTPKNWDAVMLLKAVCVHMQDPQPYRLGIRRSEDICFLIISTFCSRAVLQYSRILVLVAIHSGSCFPLGINAP